MTPHQLLKYLRETEFDVQSARVCLLAADIYFRTYADTDLFDHNLSPAFGYVKTFDDKSAFYEMIPKKTMHEFCYEVYLEYLEAPEKLIKKIETRDKIHRKIEALWDGYKRAEHNDPKEILDFIRRLLSLVKEWVAYGMIGEDKWQIIEEEFAPEFAAKNGLSEAEVRSLMAVLSHPESVSAFNLERKLLLEICLYVLSNSNLKEAILKKDFERALKDKFLKEKEEEYRKKFFWTKTDFYSPTEITPQVLLEDVYKEISAKNEKQIKEELKKADANVAALHKEKEHIISKLKIDQKDRRIFELLKSAVAWHDKRKEDMMKQFYFLFSAFKGLSAATGLAYDNFLSLTMRELESFLKTGVPPKKEPQTVFLTYEKGKKSEFFYGEVAEEMLAAVLLRNENKEELTGMVACRGNGNIEGRIRIVTDPRNDEFQDGDILVTSMTRVEFVPLMRRAKAIITDEGGIACHAAIISRELGIPCIIGTKIATKVLRDGDMVEVDAEKGIVKKLN